MLWESLSNEEKNKARLQLLLRLAKPDLDFNSEELSYLIYFYNNSGLDPELINIYQKDAFFKWQSLPEDEKSRMKILYHLLFAMNADSFVNQDGIRIMHKLSFKLGFHENMTNDFIEIMKIYPLNKLPNDALLSIIRKYSN